MDDEPKQFWIRDPENVANLLGHIVMAWNRCESGIRELLHVLASGGDIGHRHITDILVSELGTVSLAEALNCFADEFPDSCSDISDAVMHVSSLFERLRPYRNYYVHGISQATVWGQDFSEDALRANLPLSETFIPGPFGQIWQRTAKGKVKIGMTFIPDTDLSELLERLNSLHPYISGVSTALRAYFNGRAYEEQLPPKPPLPDILKKQALTRRALQLPPALVPRRKPRSPRKRAE